MASFYITLVVLTSLLSVMAHTYTSKGPYAYDVLKWKHGVFSFQDRGEPRILDFTITFPVALTQAASTDAAYPLIFLFSGFEMHSTYYTPYARHLASWGYTVVQYDVPVLPIFTDRTHVNFFPQILDWVKQQLHMTTAVKNVDMEAVGVVGHSRGGKLASLIAVEHPVIKALFLIDPVNGDGRIELGSLDYPSAVQALTGKDLKLAIAGSSVSGSCNPVDYDYRHFWEVAGTGSWLSVISQAGHSQFFSAPRAQQWILDRICKKGKSTNKEVIKRTYPSLVAWFELAFRPTQTNEGNALSQMDEFFLWIESKKRNGELSFFIKGEAIEV